MEVKTVQVRPDIQITLTYDEARKLKPLLGLGAIDIRAGEAREVHARAWGVADKLWKGLKDLGV